MYVHLLGNNQQIAAGQIVSNRPTLNDISLNPY
jgi:hypothetical protein